MTRKNSSSAEFGGGKKALALLIGKLCGIAAVSNASYAGPAGGVVTAGEGAISTPTSTSTVIDQASNRLSVDWQSFDVAANESVRFNQPTSNAVALNRILDQKASEVFGRIDANGRVVLFNSHGIMFGPGSQVNVGSLLATSLNVVSFDDSTGQLRLQALGTPGAIVNSGTINAAPGGSVSLVGGSVTNNGHIVADLGSVNLAAGRSATLDFFGGGLLRFEADSSLLDNPGGAAAGVSNAGTISAAGGQVLLTTSAAQSVFSRAVNNDGVVSANRIENVGGAIRLVGAGGTVVNSGVLDASGVGAGSTGGSVQVLGENVGLFGHARVDVSGDAGGGVALIGGDYLGSNPDILNANRTIVGSNAQINADARVSGDGGRVIVWSDDLTRFYGDISGRGGADSGNGGFAEVSSHGVLDFSGMVNLGAPAGAGGLLLLDPEDLAVEDGGPETDVDYADFTDSPLNASIDADAVVAALEAGAAVNLLASDDITIDEAINAGTGTAAGPGLTLRAGDNIFINQSITTTNRNVSITAADAAADPTSQDGDGTGDVVIAAGANIDAGTATVLIRSQGNADAGLGDLTSAGGVITAGSLTVSGAVVNLNTTIDTLTSANATGALTITNTSNGAHPALAATNAAGLGVNISTNANLTVGMVNAGAGNAQLTSANGAILDDNLATAIAGANVSLDAQTGIGTVTNLRAGTGSSVDVNTAGALTASVASASGQINLDLVQLPTLAAGAIDLGGATAATGTILLQSAGNLDASVGGGFFTAGAIDLEAGNTAQVGLRSGDTLTLPVATTSIFDAAPGTLALNGATAIVDENGGALAFTVDSLIFDSGAAATLNTDVDLLSAAIADANLTVTEADDLELGAVNLGTGTANFGVGGALSDGAGATPSVVANQLTITGAASVDLDTNVNILNAGGVTGTLTVREQTGALAVTDASSGGAVNVSTVAGSMTVTNAAGNGVTLSAGGGASDLTLATVNAGAGTATLSAGDAIADGAPVVTSVTANQLTVTSANSVDLDTNVNTLNASNVTGALSVREASGPLNVVNAASTGGTVTLTAATGALTNVTASGANVSLNALGAGGAISLVDVDAGAGTVNIATVGAINDAVGAAPSVTANQLNIAGGALSVDLDTNIANLDATSVGGAVTIREQNALVLGTVNAGANTVSLSAGGAISDGAGPAASVLANQLTITAATSVNLDTDVITLNATGVGAGGLTIREQSALAATAANSTGAVNLSTAAGSLNVTNSAGSNVTLNAAGAGSDIVVTGTVNSISGTASLTAADAITLGTVNAGVNNVTLAAGGAVTDAGGPTPSVVANTLTITSAGSVDLDTNITTLNASGVGTTLTIRDQVGDLSVTNAAATGAVDISTIGGALGVTNASGNGVTLTAGGAGSNLTVATVNAGPGGTALLTAANGSILDDDVGTSTATSISGGSVTLNAGISIGSVTDFDTAAGLSVDVNTSGLLTATTASSTDAINLNIAGAPIINAGGITLGAGANRSGTVLLQSPGALNLENLTAGAINIGTPNTVSVGYVSGGLLTLPDGGSPTDTSPFNLLVSGADIVQGAAQSRTIGLTANSLIFNASAPAGAFQLNTNVGSLSANVGTAALSVTEFTGDITLGNVVAQSIDVLANTGAGAILDDGDDTTELTAGSVTLTATNAIGGVSAVDVDTANFTAVSTSGDVSVNSVGATVQVNISAAAGAGDVTLAAAGAVTDAAGATPSVVADQFTIANAGSVNLDTNINNLNASGVTGALSIREQTGALTVANATAGGAVNVSTAAGALTVTNATGAGVSLAAGGAGNGLTLGAVNAGAGTATLAAGGAITDAGGATPSVVANQLTITSAGSADLDTDVNILDASNVLNNLTIREQAGDLAVVDADTTGTVTLTSVNGGLTNVNAFGANIILTAGGAGSALSLGTVTAGGIATLAAGGAITDAAGATPSVVANELVITSAGSANLDTNVNILTASGVTGALTVREQSGDLNVGNASAGGAVSVASASGALTNVNATGSSVTLNAGSNISLVAVNSGAGTTTLTAGGAITDAAGATPSVVANQLTITGAGSADLDTDVNTLNASGVTGALSVREQTGALAVTSATATGAVNVSTVAGALTNVNATGSNVTLNASTDLSLASVNSASGTTTLTAGGAITDAAGATPSVVANQLTITGAGSADLDTNVNTLNASGVTGALTVREQTGALTVANATSTGAVNVSTVAGALAVTNASGNAVSLSAAGAGNGLTLGAVNAGTGTATLAAGGAITDAAGATPSVVANQLTITGATSADLDTNVNTLSASGVTGALTVREQTGALTVANATATGAVNVSTVAGAMTVTNASGNAVSLSAGGAGNGLTLGAVNAGTGTATLAAGGAITDAAGATPSVVANQLTITGATSADLDTNVNTLSASGVTGALTVREQTGALTVANATATGAVNLSTAAGALTATSVSGNGVTLSATGAGNNLTLGTVNAGSGTAALTAGGAIADGTTGTAITAATATMTAASIGSATNTIDTAVGSLSATTSSGGMFFRQSGNGAITLANLSAATNQDIVVGAVGDITVGSIAVSGSNGSGRVLLAAGSDILASGGGTHITAQNVELRAGGIDSAGGSIGAGGNFLRLNVPASVPGGSGTTVPSVLLLQNQSTSDPNVAAQANQTQTVSNVSITTATFDPAQDTNAQRFLTTTFSTRTAEGEAVLVQNADFFTSGISGGATGQVVLAAANASNAASANTASNAQGEGTLYIDWASFDPDVSLFGTVNPPICLPRDQAEEDDGSTASTGGCASTTAQYDGSFRMPEVKLVITSRGVEWVTVPSGNVTVFPLIGQIR